MQPVPSTDITDKRPSLVLSVGVVLWLYSTVSDMAAHNFLEEYFEPRKLISFIDVQSRLLQHILMLPLLIGTLYAALHVHLKTVKAPVKWAFYILCAVIYGLCVRPLEILAILIVHGRYDYFDPDNHGLMFMLTSPTWYRYGNIMGNAAICLLGILVILSLFGQLALSKEKLRLERLDSELLAVKLKTLQWQLNPHFVFNCLNTVSALLKSAPGKADRVLMKFSELLRMTLREQEQVYTSVNSEMEYIHRYLDLETIRFEDRLKLKIEADEEALNGSMPSLLLQPLIENAIKHGIARIPGPALITISVSRASGHLVFTVRNTSSRRYAKDQPASNGLGMRNIQERLVTLYRDAFIFKYGHTEDEDWSATIEIPFVKHKAQRVQLGSNGRSAQGVEEMAE
jgi:hypothetical protein